MTVNQLRELYPDLILQIEKECLDSHYNTMEVDDDYSYNQYDFDQQKEDWDNEQQFLYWIEECESFSVGTTSKLRDERLFEINSWPITEENNAFREIWMRRIDQLNQ